jgi:hypothetical protein
MWKGEGSKENDEKIEFLTGDPEFKALGKEIKISWFKSN